MPNDRHLVLWRRGDGDLSQFMRWLMVTHSQRRHASRGTIGARHVYQGRFRSLAVQQRRARRADRARGVLAGGDAVLSLLRYVERNPPRAGLVTRAESRAWRSARVRLAAGGDSAVPLTAPPGGLPDGWAAWVNRPQTPRELAALRRCIARGAPFGREARGNAWLPSGAWNRPSAPAAGRGTAQEVADAFSFLPEST